MPELPEVEAWRRQLDPLVKRSPIERAGPAHIATLKTFDPPLSALDGRGLRGRRAARRSGSCFPTDDGELVLMVHLMSAGRLKYVARRASKGPKTPAFRLRFADGGELQSDRGRHEEARRRLAAAAGRARRTSSRISGPEADELDAEDVARDPRRRTRAGCIRCSATSA